MFYGTLGVVSATVFLASLWLGSAALFLAWFCICVPGLVLYVRYTRDSRASREPTYDEYRTMPESERERCPGICMRLKGPRGYSGGQRYCPFCKVYMRAASRECPCCSAPLRRQSLNAWNSEKQA